MKKFFLSLLIGLFCMAGMAQVTKTNKPVAKPVNPMKTLNDSASYAIGLSVANFYKQQGFTKINSAMVTRAINDILANKKPLLNDSQGNDVMNRCISQIQEKRSKAVIDSGMAFLARNKKRSEVKTTATGLQYEVMREGTGIKPALADTFVVNYRGTLLDGTPFDNSYDRGEPLQMPMNKVITGWTEGLQLMSVGSKYKFYIPHHLGYGSFDNGPIPGGSTLVFEIELLDVKKAQ